MQPRLPFIVAAASAAAVTAHIAARKVGRTWGATWDETRLALPGDDLVPDPHAQVTMAVSIDAPAEQVWPWLLQMGVDRGGFYTHLWVENGMLRQHVRNASRIDPAWQDLAVGDQIWFNKHHPPAPRFGPRVVAIESNRHLVCALGRDPERPGGTWQFILQPRGDTTRLVFRSRSSRIAPLRRRLTHAFLDPGYYYMDAGMLRGIATRAAGDPRELPPVVSPPLLSPAGTPLTALVAVASPTGATLQIARAIAADLRWAGIAADLRDVREVTRVQGYDAFVVGSAIHSHYWLTSAKDFVERHRDALRECPVWLFSSGMLAVDTGAAWPEPYPRDIEGLMAASGAREHRIFTGRRDMPEPKALWSRLTSVIIWIASRKEPVPDGYTMSIGDYRDWDAIHAWARGIAVDLRSGVQRPAA